MTDYSTYSDSELLQLLSKDDHDAFDALYRRHWEELYTSAYFILKHQSACKDIVQDVFIWLWEKRSTLQISSIRPYLKAAVRFKIANLIRGDRIRESFYNQILEYTQSTAPTPSEIAEAKQMQAIIQEVINQLPAQCKVIYKLRRDEKLSNQQIAEQLGISVKTVENQITIAQKRIHHYLESYMILISFMSIPTIP